MDKGQFVARQVKSQKQVSVWVYEVIVRVETGVDSLRLES